MINKLTIELALHRNQVGPAGETYKVIQVESPVTEELLEEFRTREIASWSFIYKLRDISKERKALLNLVEHKVLKMLSKNPDLFTSKYRPSLSYLYFAFTDEEERTIFSAPHIASPIMFNPNEITNTFTLNTYTNVTINGNRMYIDKQLTNIFKRVDPIIASTETKSFGKFSNGERKHKLAMENYRLSNTLFNYFQNLNAGSSNCSNLVSCYRDIISVLPGLSTISEYELKRFMHIREDKITY